MISTMGMQTKYSIGDSVAWTDKNGRKVGVVTGDYTNSVGSQVYQMNFGTDRPLVYFRHENELTLVEAFNKTEEA